MNTPLRLFPFVLVVGLVLSYTLGEAQQPTPSGGRKLTVSSSATVQADPDTAVISFAVTATGVEGKEVRERTTKRANTIKEEIRKLGLKAVTVGIVPLPLSPLVARDPNPDGSQPTVGFDARSLFSVTVRNKDIEQLREMVVRIGDVVVENGGVGLPQEGSSSFRLLPRLGGLGGGAAPPPEKVPGPSVEWRCENDKEARQRAVKKAVEAALASARVVAEPAQLHVTEIEVQQTTLAWPRVRLSSSEGDATIAGRVPIEVNVKVSCSY